jgi:hypothetical protein
MKTILLRFDEKDWLWNKINNFCLKLKSSKSSLTKVALYRFFKENSNENGNSTNPQS